MAAKRLGRLSAGSTGETACPTELLHHNTTSSLAKMANPESREGATSQTPNCPEGLILLDLIILGTILYSGSRIEGWLSPIVCYRLPLGFG
jgi:hypothetical protein